MVLIELLRPRRRVAPIWCALALVLANVLVADAAAQQVLPERIQHVMMAHGMAEDGLSLFVQDVDESEPLLSFNPDIPRNPASTIKLLTTIAALDTLGPAYTWQTSAYLQGSLEDGQLDGDLIIEGGGDPFLVVERWWSFVQALRQAGLQGIGGDLVIDNSFFSVGPTDPAAFDGQPFRVYNVVPDALLVNFQAVNFQFRPDPDGSGVRVDTIPDPVNLRIDNRLKLANGGCRGYQRGIAFDRAPERLDTVVLSGSFPASCRDYEMTRAVLNAPTYAYGTFRALWEQSGGTLEGSVSLGRVAADAEPFFVMDSLPLAEIIRRINKFSSNVMTRHLLLTLGAEMSERPGTVQKGKDAIDRWLLANGLMFPEMVLDNGAGLSRETRIAARSMGELLLVAQDSQYEPEFLASLPLSALDGTLRDRFRTGGLVGRVRMKTGRLDHVSAIAGYVNARSGRTFAVVAFQNDEDAHRGTGEEVQNALVRWVFQQ